MRTPALALVVLAALCTSALADDKPAVAALRKQEAAATAKCAAELVKCAKALLALKAVDEAREELRNAMTLAPQDAACRKEFAKLLGATGDTPEAAADKVEAARKSSHAACIAALDPVLKAWDKADRPDDFARVATAAVACLGNEGALAALELKWDEDYVCWARAKDVERWEKGSEFVDDAWLDAEKVAKLDLSHANWKTPWIVGDGVHEVRTAMPYRMARRVLRYVQAYRQFVVDSFAGEWEIVAAKAPLPIVVSATQDEHHARLLEYDPGAAKSSAAAIYPQRTGGVCPCFVTFEPKVNGAPTKIEWTTLVWDLRHEVAHQILYESCMAQGAGVGGNVDWVSEGVANLLACHVNREGRFRLSRPAQVPYGGGFESGSFAWSKANFDGIAPLSKYLTEPKGNLDAGEDYFVATTVTYFLLVGGERRYRPAMIRFLLAVHTAKADAQSFAKCFGKVDFAKMQEEWKEFVAGIVIDPK